ncbi:MAG: hypothetical protein IPG83_06895 [Novosphingobium sp.]|nr:hypothetical protein [Novosphingobium sp.]
MRWLAALPVALGLAGPALADDIDASEPRDLSVTIYRDPGRGGGGQIQLGRLGGFAVITETRTVTLPAGKHRLRFVGVVDGIVPESAIVTGLPGGVIEKNRDAALLSPAALFRAFQGRAITLKRTSRVTGKAVTLPAQLVSAGPDGVIFRTAEGEEALRCTGLAETFSYDRAAEGLSARPVLSVLTSTSRPVTAEIKLTYLAEGFDWSASYTADVDPAGKSLNLGGWITLANSNSVSLPDARTQIVAGGLRREDARRLRGVAPQVSLNCWPQQRTHQIPRKPERPYALVSPYREQPDGEDDAYLRDSNIVVTGSRVMRSYEAMPAPAMVAPPPPPPPPQAEQLGDLKLYRLPERTTIAARQMKQSRLLDQPEVTFEHVLDVELSAFDNGAPSEVGRVEEPNYSTLRPVTLVRTRNDKVNGLGLPLPAGQLVVRQGHQGRMLPVGQPALRDTAEDEKIELRLNAASDITVERRTVRVARRKQWQHLKFTSARGEPATIEVRFTNSSAMRFDFGDKAESFRRDGEQVLRLQISPDSTHELAYTVSWN